MVEILEFVFRSFWTFVGSMLILGMFIHLIRVLVRGYPPCDCDRLQAENDAFHKGCHKYFDKYMSENDSSES